MMSVHHRVIGLGLTVIVALLSARGATAQTDRRIIAWGDNAYGQTTVPSGTFSAISAGSVHALALRVDGTLVGWGENSNGQATVPTGTFTAIAAGGKHSLALRADGTLVGWGDNVYGQATVPTGTFTAVAAGQRHSLALRADGTLIAWGDTSFHQTDVPAGAFTAIAAGGYHNLALRADGTVVAWGNNSDGQAIVPPGTYRAIAAGFYHSLAIRTDGTLAAWGNPLLAAAPQGTFKAIDAGVLHSLALRDDGSMVAWGENAHGEANAPVRTDAVAISGGGRFSLALVDDPLPVARCRPAAVYTSDPEAFVSIDAGSFEPSGGALTLVQDPSGPYPIGVRSVTLTVRDEQGNTASCSAQALVLPLGAAAPAGPEGPPGPKGEKGDPGPGLVPGSLLLLVEGAAAPPGYLRLGDYEITVKTPHGAATKVRMTVYVRQ